MEEELGFSISSARSHLSLQHFLPHNLTDTSPRRRGWSGEARIQAVVWIPLNSLGLRNEDLGKNRNKEVKSEETSMAPSLRRKK